MPFEEKILDPDEVSNWINSIKELYDVGDQQHESINEKAVVSYDITSVSKKVVEMRNAV